MFIVFPFLCQAQLGGVAVQEHNIQLRSLFNELQAPIAPEPQADVFYDMSVHLSYKKWWSDSCPDTNEINNWSVLYEEVWMAHYDTNKMTRIDTFWNASEGYGGDTIPIGLLDYSFHSLKDSALTSDSFFIFDGNDQLLDNFKFKYNGGTSGNPNDPNQWAIDYSYDPNPIYQNADSSTPYITENLFSVTTFKNNAFFNEVTFVIDPALLSIGGYQLPNYIPDHSLRIDFGDGNGYQIVDHTQKNYVTVYYPNEGSKALRAGFFDTNGNQLKASTTKINVAAEQKVPPSSLIFVNGLNVGLYRACHDANDPNFREKFIIYLSGIDPLEDVGIEEIYSDRILEEGLAELRNHGYSFVIVDWKSITRSLEINADHVIGLINELKCNYLGGGDLGEQFVVIGESMGGLIGRYALRKMELFNTPCKPSLKHNTRLFISYDAPQAGAYIPLAGQHFIANRGVLGAMFTFSVIRNQELQHKYLYSDATQQMLLLHTNAMYNPLNGIPTNTISSFKNSPAFSAMTFTYQPSPKRTAFMGHLYTMGNQGYPKYCKKMALSLGLLSGDKQLARTDTTIVNPGDGYLNGSGDIKYTILNIEKSLISYDFDLNTIDASGFGTIYRHEMGMKGWKLKLKWKTIIRPFKVRIFGTTYTVGHTVRIPDGVDIVFDYLISKGREELSQGATPYDHGPGAYYRLEEVVDRLSRGPVTTGFSLTKSSNIQTIPCYGSPTPAWEAEEFELFSARYDMAWCSKAARYNFIPTYSALDYGYSVGNSVNYDHNILADNNSTKMSQTPFDIIMGLAPEPGYPTTYHPYSRNVQHVNNLLNFLMFDPSQHTLLNQRPMYLINREIGEDTLFLSNTVFDRNVAFSTFDYLEAGNSINPFYEYDGILNQRKLQLYLNSYDPVSHKSNHIYSKNQGVDVLSGHSADMYYPVPTNTQYKNSGINGNINLNPGPPQAACNDSSFNKVIWKINENSSSEYAESVIFSYYPNPVKNHLNIDINLSKEFIEHCTDIDCSAESTFKLYSLQGVLLKRQTFKISVGDNQLRFDMEQLNLSSGTYLLKGTLQNEVSHFKIIVQ